MVCVFHEEDKLRTVIWDFIGEPVPPHWLRPEKFSQPGSIQSRPSTQRLEPYLEVGEIAATAKRSESGYQMAFSRNATPPPPLSLGHRLIGEEMTHYNLALLVWQCGTGAGSPAKS